ncbi:hypothetical protein FIBSPDRAFT_909798 [Athelia psychrophila]|uniref:Uncharacterized protein n=1 Tax=Athelia psychrophila TaxID=1759441 RepID=A0A166NCZ1_9AGAM|nr:hypothetical protein FIBSPDRAFT_909798 [Fibularhizoctonia sp. CBS 109695]
MDNREDLARISIDTLQEWTLIKSNYLNAAVVRLDALLKAKDINSAESRDRCLIRINEYVDSVFEMAKPNIRVNGQNFEEISEDDDEIEPFDEALDRHIWSLSDQRLKWDRMMARTRVERPREVEAMLQDLFDRQQDAATQDIEVAVDDADNFDDLTFARLPDIEQAFLKTSSIAEELNQATIQFERSKQVKTATKEIKALKP